MKTDVLFRFLVLICEFGEVNGDLLVWTDFGGVREITEVCGGEEDGESVKTLEMPSGEEAESRLGWELAERGLDAAAVAAAAGGESLVMDAVLPSPFGLEPGDTSVRSELPGGRLARN